MTNLGVVKDKKDPDLLHHVIVEFASESAVGSVLRTSLDTDLVKLCLSVIHDPEEQLEELVRLTYLSEEEVNERFCLKLNVF